MCGIFGFVGTEPDFSLLELTAFLAGRRGPHAFGFCWFEERQLKAWKIAQPVDRYSPNLRKVRGSVIGTCRLATSGSYRTETNNQPLTSESIGIAHNGIIHNAAELFRDFGYEPKTDNDSEAWLALLMSISGSMEQRLGAAAALVSGNPYALLILDRQGVYARRRGHPLYRYEGATGTYFCSRPFHPEARLLPEMETLSL